MLVAPPIKTGFMSAPQMVPAPVVLVVDDEPTVLRLMERALASAGYQVHAASNGLRALEIALGLPAPPAILVSDINMEPIDGPDLARLMTHSLPGIKVLFVSGFPTDPAHAPVTGPVLKKPFELEVLVNTVAGLLGTSVIQGANSAAARA